MSNNEDFISDVTQNSANIASNINQITKNKHALEEIKKSSNGVK